MTAQLPDCLRYQNKWYRLCTLPMDTCSVVRINRYELHCHTALERGYVADWVIEDGRLWLVEIRGAFDEPNRTPISTKTYFPDVPVPVFAFWYSGTLRCPIGKRLRYVHYGFESIHERDLLLKIERGHLVRASLRTNPFPKKGQRPSIPDFLKQGRG